jgi:ketosteroid isomerase-like protein
LHKRGAIGEDGMITEPFAEKVAEIYEAIAGLPDDNELFYNPDLLLTWIEMLGGPYGGVYNSLSEARENIFDPIGAQWADFRFTPSGFHEMGGIITVEGYYIGVNRKTGKTLNARVVHLWKHLNEKILIEQFCDTALFLEAME